jgi:hypothetical protein
MDGMTPENLRRREVGLVRWAWVLLLSKSLSFFSLWDVRRQALGMPEIALRKFVGDTARQRLAVRRLESCERSFLVRLAFSSRLVDEREIERGGADATNDTGESRGR